MVMRTIRAFSSRSESAEKTISWWCTFLGFVRRKRLLRGVLVSVVVEAGAGLAATFGVATVELGAAVVALGGGIVGGYVVAVGAARGGATEGALGEASGSVLV